MKNTTAVDVKKLAQLASLQVSEEEVKKIEAQLGDTLDFIQNLSELDVQLKTSDSTVTEESNRYFEDGQENSRLLTQEQVLKNASKSSKGQFVVSRILK